MFSNGWVAVEWPWIGVLLGIATGILLGRMWRNMELQDHLLLLKLQLEAKQDEVSALRNQIKRLRYQAKLAIKNRLGGQSARNRPEPGVIRNHGRYS